MIPPGLVRRSGRCRPVAPQQSLFSANGSLRFRDDEIRVCRWANQAPDAVRGRRCKEKPGAMETQRHQQKFLTLECEGRSSICTSTTLSRRRAPNYFLRLLLLLGGGGGRAAEDPYHCWSFHVIYKEKEERQLGSGELTTGPTGLWGGKAEEEWPGLGDSMRGPWIGRVSWHCPACARCGQPCSRCSPAEPKETGCEYGGCRGTWGIWQRG
jgi:hypothetical protein